ncbi:MAG: GNAT family N-acetyltransferase [Sedimentisphaerales bacterium]|nr:GNAT family N-acetyltransferase [Sedimentisphaerales bacterium]
MEKKKTIITGKKIQLRRMAEGDLVDKVRWFNNSQVNKSLILHEPINLEDTIMWFKSAKNDPSRRDWIIESRSGLSLGVVGLNNINIVNKSACFYIVIGEPDYWGKGIGTAAARLLIKWAFDTLGLAKVWSTARKTNLSSICLMKKVGFLEEGLLRREECIKGEFLDVVRMGLLQEEFIYKDHQEYAGSSETSLLMGKTVQLRLMRENDLELRVNWFNDPEVSKTLILSEPITLESTSKWYQKAKEDATRLDLMILTLDEIPIGVTGFRKIDRGSKSACAYIVIGAKDYWGKGIMYEALKMLIEYGFNSMNLQKMWGDVRLTNVASIVTLKKLGFHIERTAGEEACSDGGRIEIVRLVLPRDEFKPGPD